ncbi:MAG: hypothetical protein ABWX85_06725 [Arthrobacter sp.]
MGDQGLADVAAQLYALPFDDFIAARTAAAKVAAAAKDQRPLAADVRSLPKPSVAAWTVNMLAARRPEVLRDLAGLGQSMRAAQSSLDAIELRRLGQERRQLLGSAVKAAQAVAEQQGRKISSAIAAEVEETLRAATADAGAAAAVQSGRLLRGLSADGVDVVDLSEAVALPGLTAPATVPPKPPPGTPAPGSPARADQTRTPGREQAEPRLRAVRQGPRKSTPSALERARGMDTEAEEAAKAAAEEARQAEEALATSTALSAELSDTVRQLREQLARSEQDLKAARKRREHAAAQAQQANRAADRARRTADLARERVLRLGNTPEA